jgi:hypothetical protein
VRKSLSRLKIRAQWLGLSRAYAWFFSAQ